MNIKINIKDCDCSPAVISRKQISQVQSRKKSMLYAAPTKDKKSSAQQISQQKKQATQKQHSFQASQQQGVLYEAQKKFISDLSSISKTQADNDLQSNTHKVLQKQNQILQSNQRTIQQLMNHKNQTREVDNKEIRKMFEQNADKIAKQVNQIKRIRDQILEAGQNYKRTIQQGRQVSPSKGTQKIVQMNANLKNLVQVSKNHIQGMQNLQGIKSLQNFNIQNYTKQVNDLKRLITQYQKQSQHVQHQLRLRSLKLQRLQVPPNFQQQLLLPYQTYLKKKADSIDLHSIRDKVYQKLGVFDYGKFQNDINIVSNQVKNQINQFHIICKQYRVEVPDIKLDKKELSKLDLKLPSILDQYKASKGIVFNEERPQQTNSKAKEAKQSLKNTQKQVSYTGLRQLPYNDKKQLKKQGLRTEITQNKAFPSSKPIDYSSSVKLTRQKKDIPSVLQTKQQIQKKQVQKSTKINKKENHQSDFQKYMQNRAREELALIYQEKKNKLINMEKQLYQTCKEQPKFMLNLDLKNKTTHKQANKVEIQKQQIQEQQYSEDFDEQQKPQKVVPNKQSNSKEQQVIKSVGTQVLRQKLKNLFAKKPSSEQVPHFNNQMGQVNHQMGQVNQSTQLQSMAQGFISMINNTLTQVNASLSQSIQKKQSQNLPTSHPQRRSPNKIIIPKLEQFRAPPVFNMQMAQPVVYQQRRERKIISRDYDDFKVKQDEDSQLNISTSMY